MVHTPLTRVPAQGCGCVVVVVVDDGGALVVVVVVDDGGVGGVLLAVVVVVDELSGGVEPSLDGTQSPNPRAKNRRGLGATRAEKQTRSVAPASIGCGPDGTQSSHGRNTRAERPLTVTGKGGVNRTELSDG